MTLIPASESKDLHEVAKELVQLLISKERKLAETIESLDRDIDHVKSLTRLSEDQERSKALAKHLAQLTRTEQLRTEVRESGGLLRRPFKTIKYWQAHKDARSAYASAEADFDAPNKKAARDARIAEHNRQVEAEHNRAQGLKQQRALRNAAQLAIAQFRTTAADAMRAAGGRGWLAKDFPQQFRRLGSFVEGNDIAGANECLASLTFQRRPVDSLYENWKREAETVRIKAYEQYAGMAASGSYTEIARHSIELAAPLLRKQARDTLSRFEHPADQWQAISSLLADPRRFKTDALWAIYWAMYQCGQWVAQAASESDPHEDVFTGKMTAQIDRWLAGWATKRIREFGYPEVRSYLGTLEIASTVEETRLGADIGLIVDLNIGDVVCRKIALLQAKKSQDGVSNIGSDRRQLSKLSCRQNAGFYLFYHQSTHPVMAPAPSVCTAHELAEEVTQLGKDIDATYLRMNVRSMGWDWATFISFGLCNPNSHIGQSFDTVEEAFTALGNGDARHLPKYLHVIAITDEPRVKELRTKLHEHYIESAKAMAQAKEKERHLSRDSDGPSHSM